MAAIYGAGMVVERLWVQSEKNEAIVLQVADIKIKCTVAKVQDFQVLLNVRKRQNKKPLLFSFQAIWLEAASGDSKTYKISYALATQRQQRNEFFAGTILLLLKTGNYKESYEFFCKFKNCQILNPSQAFYESYFSLKFFEKELLAADFETVVEKLNTLEKLRMHFDCPETMTRSALKLITRMRLKLEEFAKRQNEEWQKRVEEIQQAVQIDSYYLLKLNQKERLNFAFTMVEKKLNQAEADKAYFYFKLVAKQPANDGKINYQYLKYQTKFILMGKITLNFDECKEWMQSVVNHEEAMLEGGLSAEEVIDICGSRLAILNSVYLQIINSGQLPFVKRKQIAELINFGLPIATIGDLYEQKAITVLCIHQQLACKDSHDNTCIYQAFTFLQSLEQISLFHREEFDYHLLIMRLLYDSMNQSCFVHINLNNLNISFQQRYEALVFLSKNLTHLHANNMIDDAEFHYATKISSRVCNQYVN